MAQDWDGVSIPDLTEDKQRGKAILINAGLKSAKSDATPQYLFDKDRIKNVNDLNWKHDKFIGINGRVDNAIMPVTKSTIHQSVNLIMDILDTAAQKATATPDIKQGMNSQGTQTLGELNLVATGSETRYAMNAKVYGWSEKDFWQQWYRQYKLHFKKEIDEKIVRIQGALAPTWRPLTRENIIADVDPDVKIESRVVSEAKRRQKQTAFMGFANLAVQNPNNDRRFIEKMMAKLYGMTHEEIELAFPSTIDEMQAQKENDLINMEKLPQVKVQDDHRVHIQIHAKANQNPQNLAHTRAHEKLMLTRRDRPELFQPPQMVGGQPQGGQAPPPIQTPSQVTK